MNTDITQVQHEIYEEDVFSKSTGVTWVQIHILREKLFSYTFVVGGPYIKIEAV